MLLVKIKNFPILKVGLEVSWNSDVVVLIL